jgi:hypothetical protein
LRPSRSPSATERQRDATAEAARNLDRLRTGWLAQAHERLDAAVLAAYGWPADLDSQELLTRMLALNLARAMSSSTPNAT